MLKHLEEDSSSTTFTFISVFACVSIFSLLMKGIIYRSALVSHNCISSAFENQKMQSAVSLFYSAPSFDVSGNLMCLPCLPSLIQGHVRCDWMVNWQLLLDKPRWLSPVAADGSCYLCCASASASGF